MHTNRILNIRKKRFWASVLLVQFFLFYFLSKSETAIAFFKQLFEAKKYFHQLIFSEIPFSAGDVFYVLIVISLIYLILNLFKKQKRQKSAVFILIFLNIFYFIYQIFWGMLYFQAPILDKLPQEDVTVLEAKSLSLKYLKLCIDDRNQVSEDKNGIFEIKDLKQIQAAILGQQSKLPKTFSNKKNTLINDFKPSLFKNVMSYTGILGYYNPFTAEAQFNSQLPATYLPFTLAHESAHQLGFAREQEANFIGFLIGKNSKNKSLKYSTDLFALKSLLTFVSVSDTTFVNKIISNYSTKMARDRKNERLFVKNHQGLLDDFFLISNNLFLKSNQQEGNITYSYFTQMLIKYERTKP